MFYPPELRRINPTLALFFQLCLVLAAILAVGTVSKVAVPVEKDDDTVEVAWDDQIKVTASFDHKVVDGAVGGEWMREFKKAVENPLNLLL